MLTPAFAEILANEYEKQEVVMRLYFPDMVAQLDLRREQKRLANFQFANETSGRTIRVTGEKRPRRLRAPN